MPTKIEWAEETWNPITGCTPISPGCANCYAQRMAKRLAGRCGYPADEPFKVMVHPERLSEPLRWKKPRRVFVCSMGDLFHPDVPFEFIDKVFSIMFCVPKHSFLVLTKRPDRMREYITTRPRDSMKPERALIQDEIGFQNYSVPWPLPNVWLGVTCENQEQADKRIPVLLQIPAAVRFVSVEPMLGAVEMLPYLLTTGTFEPWEEQRGLDWVICGGETGPGARPIHPGWIRSLRDQCQAAGVSFFFKQHGEWMWWHQDGIPYVADGLKARHEWPDKSHSFRVGKKAAGRLLDGREWNEIPGVE